MDPASPSVSVIICAYNAERHIGPTVESVLDQTFKDYELVVVDDGSTDATRGIVESYAKRHPSILYHYQPNAGFGAARNKAMSLARGRWIAIIDHDDLCLPERLQVQFETAKAHPEAALIFSDSEHFLDDGNILRRQFDGFDPCGLELGPTAATEALLMHGCFIDSETAFFRKDAAAAIGGFSEVYRYVNDYDIFLRLGMTRGFAGVNRVLSRWRVHERQLSQTARETMIREELQIYREWSRRSDISQDGRRAARLRLFANLLRAARLKALRDEAGGGLSLCREIAGAAPGSPSDWLWCLERLRAKLARLRRR